ncbi:hypothetical protein NDU88_006952 [Pleurodeles waltl]|uniref:Uncharacterized protein n=1 Tax=Pleurodeles waltl TaxID=8319 RepID=A0AAV7SR66_PLEWA|nr:hypothetical protein NDU88_006952 [Pleurodeles waltl]
MCRWLPSVVSSQEIALLQVASGATGAACWSRDALELQLARRGAALIPLRENRGSGSTSKSAGTARKTFREEKRKAVVVGRRRPAKRLDIAGVVIHPPPSPWEEVLMGRMSLAEGRKEA